MQKDQYYSIGQAAKICNLSIQTLRYYDKIGLVIPGKTDNSSGYRYYSNLDLLHIKIVQDMKMLNFSLNDIGIALKNDNLENLLKKLEFKREETLVEIHRLDRIEKSISKRMLQIHFLQKLGNGLKDLNALVELKCFPDRKVTFYRTRTACGMESSIVHFTELFNRLEVSGITPDPQIMTVYHENIMTFDRSDTELEFCIIVPEAVEQTILTRVISGGEYITAVYSGIPNEASCKQIYTELLEWIEKNGYRERGPSIEQYLIDMSQMAKPEEFIVELQVPVEKVLTL